MTGALRERRIDEVCVLSGEGKEGGGQESGRKRQPKAGRGFGSSISPRHKTKLFLFFNSFTVLGFLLFNIVDSSLSAQPPQWGCIVYCLKTVKTNCKEWLDNCPRSCNH